MASLIRNPSRGTAALKRPLFCLVRPLSTVVDQPEIGHSHEHVTGERKVKAADIFRRAVTATKPRHTWTKEEVAAIYHQPLMELAFQSVSRERLDEQAPMPGWEMIKD